MFTISASSNLYNNHSQYLARIIGKDPKFGFSREFIGRKNGSTSTAVVDEPGLYEICEIDKKGRKGVRFIIAAPGPGGELMEFRAGADNLDKADPDHTAAAIAKRIDAGESVAGMIEVAPVPDSATLGYRLRTKQEAVRASAAVTLDSAIESCWAVLQALPEREAKKVLTALRAKVSPPKAAAAQATEGTPSVE